MELDSDGYYLFKDRKSKFYAHIYRISSADDVEKILKEQKRKYKKARHHCWAYRIEVDGRIEEKSKDDGEVGAPGKALLELLRGNEMIGYLLVVSRIFGGIKLGIGGVRRAFVEAGKGAIEDFRNRNTSE
jgi:putative IMPACT (imprinted ancient) family translation regulator